MRALLFLAAISLTQAAIFAVGFLDQRRAARNLDMAIREPAYVARVAALAVALHDARTGARRTEAARALDGVLRAPADPATPGTSAYVAAARRLLADPHDAAALGVVRERRAALLAAAESDAVARAREIGARNARLAVASIVDFVVMFFGMIVLCARVVAPSERRAAALLARLARREAELKSLFLENPDAIAYYDRAGRVVRSNTASYELLGPQSIALMGEHFLRHVDRAESERATAAFARTLAGEHVELDTFFVDSGGVRIDVHVNLFPNIVDGEIGGVIGVARDTRRLRRAEAAYVSQSERIYELYRVASFAYPSSQRQTEETLVVAARRLAYDWAAFVRTDGDAAGVVTALVAPGGGEAPCADETRSLAPAYARVASGADDAWSIDDVERANLAGALEPRRPRTKAIAGARVARGSTVFGTLVLGTIDRPHAALEASDLDFLRLVAALVCANVQRGDQERKLDALAFFDALTGLPNRVLLDERMSEALATASRTSGRFAVHALDLDRFKPINDSFGHPVGDEVLRIIARRMEQCTRERDTVARVGGDEFVIVQALDDDAGRARELAERILASLSRPIRVGDADHEIGVSIGTAVFPGDGTDAPTLLRSADAALLRAKREGRQRQIFADETSFSRA